MAGWLCGCKTADTRSPPHSVLELAFFFFFSVTTMFLRFLHVVLWNKGHWCFLLYTSLCMTRPERVYLYPCWHLGCFWFFRSLNRTALNVFVHGRLFTCLFHIIGPKGRFYFTSNLCLPVDPPSLNTWSIWFHRFVLLGRGKCSQLEWVRQSMLFRLRKVLLATSLALFSTSFLLLLIHFIHTCRFRCCLGVGSSNIFQRKKHG